MKISPKHALFLLFFIFSSPAVFAQSKPVPINIEVIEDQYLKGLCKLLNENKTKTQVDFSAKKVSVRMPINNKMVLMEFLNTDCKAYCPKAKRVRQLHKGDEKLLRNVLKKNTDVIVKQLEAQGLKLSQ